ncbi:MAG: hypothetical protein IT211_09435 [Armatimonadetes bacterium]|nr:hypothetical protein [Armatimonadota bacterium]
MSPGYRELRQCPKCGSFGSEADTFCACCGTQLKPTCNACGTAVEQTMAFYCTHCGTRLAEGSNVTEERRSEPGSAAAFFRNHRGQ